MSNQNWNSTTPDPGQDPNEAAPGYQPPESGEPTAPSEGYQPPESGEPTAPSEGYQPPPPAQPAAPGYEPPAAPATPDYGPPSSTGYPPPASYGTPAPEGYPPAQGSYPPPPATPYGQVPPLDPYGQPAAPYGQSPAPYGQSPAPYGQPPAPYGQSPAPYGEPSAPYGQPPATPYGQPSGDYGQPAGGGYPPPAGPYGQPTQYPPAGYGVPNYPVPVGGAPLADWGKRALGAVIDYGPISVLNAIGNSIATNMSGGGFLAFVFGLAGLAWLVWNTGYKAGATGVSLGRSIAGTKLVAEATGQPVGIGLAIVRYVAHFIDSILCMVGWFMPLWDTKRQTFADKIMKTVVLDTSADPNPTKFEWK